MDQVIIIRMMQYCYITFNLKLKGQFLLYLTFLLPHVTQQT